MPLVLMSGNPCSGKTRRAQELHDYLITLSDQTQIVSDDHFGLQRNEVYQDSRKEKDFRSILKSEAQKNLSKDTVVILDAANYIKGYRYELYCTSKSCKTTHCVIECSISIDDAWSRNVQRKPPQQYHKEVFDGLVQRYETPDSRNRWDSPLFTVHAGDEMPLLAIREALLSRKPPPPNQSTQTQPLSATNFMFELDRVTQEVVQKILDYQKLSVTGQLTIPGATDKLEWRSLATPGELSRLRRQFISYVKTHPVEGTSAITNMFVHFLNSRT